MPKYQMTAEIKHILVYKSYFLGQGDDDPSEPFLFALEKKIFSVNRVELAWYRRSIFFFYFLANTKNVSMEKYEDDGIMGIFLQIWNRQDLTSSNMLKINFYDHYFDGRFFSFSVTKITIAS